ncbi:NADH dehydrogenase 21 kDa subunit [Pluteus cervinus]|uniref:NADH dehydrogenase 21 kDa subunit n=1 Tax=Pluteus cervinus TaxID=181527 RepID=A0ACD3BC20_9AGAR|nr:NADH dehydrogenase 21 kDa subunit [Pluteus cervinus]
MASKKAAESTLYHLSPKGFWKKFREVAAVNPEISSGLPIAGVNRYPQPASRPELYSTPATMASDPAQNPYWKRDVRRAYPQLSVVTQQDLSTLLLEHSAAPSVAAPAEAQAEGASGVPATQKTVDLSEAIVSITAAQKVYSESKLPPKFPTAYKRWVPEQQPDAPHPEHSYWPMSLYR